MKEIIIITENKNWKSEFTELLNKDQKAHPLKWTFLSKRSDIISELSYRDYEAVIINSGLPINSLQIILKYLASNSYKNIPIFFISENFSDFKEILDHSQFPNLQLISTPVETSSIVHTVHSVLYPPRTHDAVDVEVKINLEFLKSFIEATKYILENFCMLQNVRHLRPYLYKINEAADYAIEGNICLKSTFFEGEFIIGFSKETYLKILQLVLEQDETEINKDNADFAGEIVNMIYGQAKTVLNLTGHNFEKILPTFKLNPEKRNSKFPIVIVPLETSAGKVEILIEVIKTNKN